MLIGDAVTDVDDTFDEPDRVDQLGGDGAALHVPGNRHDPGCHGHAEGGRVERELPGYAVVDLVADLAVWSGEAAQHVDAADNPGQIESAAAHW